MSVIVEDVRKDLVKNADEQTRISGERFFKEPVKLHGSERLWLDAESCEPGFSEGGI